MDGKKVSVQESEDLKLTEADFTNGKCDLKQFAKDEEQLEVTKAGSVSIEDFDENGVHKFGAQILYAVSDGWRVVRKANATRDAVSLRSVFEGSTSGDYTFVPADVVRLKLKYEYSKTGGLAGMNVASPATVEAEPEKQTGGTYKVTYTLPTKPGFRIVLDPGPLNKYLVSPPTGKESAAELKAALERGDFDVDIANHTVYYYQQSPGNDTNPTYGNRYSDKYNGAWNSARTLTATGYTATAVGENTNPGASALTNPKLEVTLTENQLKTAQAGDGLDITVYYRRNATWYTVNHWVPKALAGTLTGNEETKTVAGAEYVRLDQETLQGRVGATTRAAAKTDGVYEQLQSTGYSQKLIESTNTEVDIYYAAADSYRVIFDTDYTYIPRQQVEMGKDVDFTGVPEPTRTGYEFAGWRYLKKDATANADGSYNDDQYTDVTKDPDDSYTLTIDYDLIGKAMLQNSGGVLALHLYPKWTPDTTQVRVVLRTENLTGEDDVQATANGGNTTYYSGKYDNYSAAPVTHEPQPETSDSHYSNAGSFTVDVNTDSSLLKSGSDKALLDDIQTQVTEQFKTAMGQSSGIDVANFYTQAAFEIVHEEGNEINYDATTASADGKTMIYVYFTRNIYELLFTYYGNATVDGNTSDYCVAISTNGYSFSNGAAVTDGNLDFGYSTSHDGGNSSSYRNGWMRASVASDAAMPVPKTITIRAKYGADLRDVWPVARSEEQVTSLDDSGNRGNIAKMISWGTTDGKYCEGGFFNSGLYNAGEPTIMGTYAAMSAEIVADPEQPVTYNNGNVDSGLRHNLVAYWFNGAISHYRNNHCYEVPELEINDNGIRTVSIYNNNTADARNVLYLVPTDNAALAKYDFNDLMTVSYDETSGDITYGVENGNYYAVRAYTNNGETKYYAVARQVDTVSSNAINKQNPSARLHMTRANTTADHSTQYTDSQGAYDGTTCGSATAPYDLYFYYNRDRYTITYMAPSDNITTATEHTLGTIELPYGAMVTEGKYGFELDYKDKNTNPKYGWIPADETSVCPDRAANGTAKWTFKGWGLGPAGVNMQWTVNQDTEAEAQAGDDFAIEGNLRLYAIWDAPTYTVTFHLNGGTGDLGFGTANIVVNVPANTRYSANGRIPRPVRGGYTLDGWYVADEDGNITQPETGFDFDQTIAENKHVAAKWSAVSTEKFSYTVYYVTDKPLDDDKDNEQVQIDTSGAIVENGGTTYYVLDKTEHKDQMFIANATLNETATLQDGYIPRDTNKILNLDQPDDTYNVIFYYDPITAGKHAVQFVLAGTETAQSPTLVKSYEVKADQTVVTPKSDAAKELTDMGYALVNRNDDGNTYTTVDKAADLKWYDTNGDAQSIDTLTGAAIPDTIVYLVQPIPYTITYRNADGSPKAATAALNAVTAAENTPVVSANGKNPTKYTTTDRFTATNPARVYDNGTWYEFSHWSLGTDTKVKNADGTTSTTDKFTTLTVGVGTVGNLTFVANWKAADTGNLTVSKTVAGTAGETDKEFEFTVTLKNTDDTALTGDYSYTGTGASNGTLKSGDTFKLKHGQSITITGLPVGTTYEVAETKAEGYTTTKNGDTGTITKDTTATAAFTNTKNTTPPDPDPGTGNLTVSKTVTGNAGDTNKDFNFTVTLDDTTISNTYGDMTFTDGVATFKLKHNESKTAANLPAGTGYTVTETEAGKDGYTTTAENETGTITKGTTVTAKFTNSKSSTPVNPDPDPKPIQKTGNLTVSKTVAGDAGETNRAFTFKVTLDNASINGKYGDMTFTNGVATITLKHGESKTATGLPDGKSYTVTETEANQDGYVTTKIGDTGTIRDGITATAAFTNTKNATPPEPGTGNLIVSKVVAGNAGDKTKDFQFTVTLGDKAINGKYGDMTFTNGVATITLKHGESKTAPGLPVDTTYKVVETKANQDGYTTVATGSSGTITKAGATAAFTNTKANATDPSKPTKPTKPSKPTNSGTPTNTSKRPIDGAPNTGDESNLSLWLMLMGASCVGVISTLLFSRKRKKRERHNK